MRKSCENHVIHNEHPADFRGTFNVTTGRGFGHPALPGSRNDGYNITPERSNDNTATSRTATSLDFPPRHKGHTGQCIGDSADVPLAVCYQTKQLPTHDPAAQREKHRSATPRKKAAIRQGTTL